MCENTKKEAAELQAFWSQLFVDGENREFELPAHKRDEERPQGGVAGYQLQGFQVLQSIQQ